MRGLVSGSCSLHQPVIGDWRDNDAAADAEQSGQSPASTPETAPDRINQALLMHCLLPRGLWSLACTDYAELLMGQVIKPDRKNSDLFPNSLQSVISSKLGQPGRAGVVSR